MRLTRLHDCVFFRHTSGQGTLKTPWSSWKRRAQSSGRYRYAKTPLEHVIEGALHHVLFWMAEAARRGPTTLIPDVSPSLALSVLASAPGASPWLLSPMARPALPRPSSSRGPDPPPVPRPPPPPSALRRCGPPLAGRRSRWRRLIAGLRATPRSLRCTKRSRYGHTATTCFGPPPPL